MKFVIYIAIALLSLSSCTKETILEVPTTENTNTEKILVSFTTVDAVKNFVNGKWAWKETILKSRAGQTQTSPRTSGIQKEIVINAQTITTFENGLKTTSENYTLTQKENGWWFESGTYAGILYRQGDQLIFLGCVVDRADDYFQRAQ